MSICKDCAARRAMVREALINAKIGKAVVQVAIGAAEAVGVKPKTGVSEMSADRKPTPKKAKESDNE